MLVGLMIRSVPFLLRVHFPLFFDQCGQCHLFVECPNLWNVHQFVARKECMDNVGWFVVGRIRRPSDGSKPHFAHYKINSVHVECICPHGLCPFAHFYSQFPTLHRFGQVSPMAVHFEPFFVGNVDSMSPERVLVVSFLALYKARFPLGFFHFIERNFHSNFQRLHWCHSRRCFGQPNPISQHHHSHCLSSFDLGVFVKYSQEILVK